MQRKPSLHNPNIKPKAITCPECDGVGYLATNFAEDDDLSQDHKKCPECKGTGKVRVVS